MVKKKTGRSNSIERRALLIQQNIDHPLYLFTLTGEELLKIADISRISRDDDGKLIGYQRAGVRRHVQDIVDYLNEDSILFPNSIILALSSKVKFMKSRGPATGDGYAKAGIIKIPVPAEDATKPAWIVDGQQRALALSKCEKRKNFPIPVNAFVADDVDLQRDQFFRVNSSKPLPHGLITELLPEVSTILPANLSAKKMPSAICDWLNQEKTSPFHKIIRRASTSKEDKATAIVNDNAVITAIKESLSQPAGCLFPYRNIATGETDFESIISVLVTYWSAVRDVFPDAWGKPPTKSRLMHGAGIRAMGRLMDRVMSTIDPSDKNASKKVVVDLKRIKPMCRWTKGRWEDMDDMKWNDIQNFPRHINLLSSVLIRAYVRAKGSGR